MAEHHTNDYEAPAVPLDLGPMQGRAFLLGLIGLGCWAVFGLINTASYGSGEHGATRDFFLTYQAAFVFWMCVPIGSMALLCLAYMTSASSGPRLPPKFPGQHANPTVADGPLPANRRQLAVGKARLQ